MTRTGQPIKFTSSHFCFIHIYIHYNIAYEYVFITGEDLLSNSQDGFSRGNYFVLSMNCKKNVSALI